MLQFIKLSDPATPAYVRAWQLYEEAFPLEERRTATQQASLLTLPVYDFMCVQAGGIFVGILGIWQLPGFTFLEHFAVLPAMRGQGLGKEILLKLQQTKPLPLVLEVEPPFTEIAKCRIAFYERAGFYLHLFAYEQPPYAPDKPWVPLQLMSYPMALDFSAFKAVVKELYRRVYQLPDKY